MTNKRMKEIKELQNKRNARRKAGLFVIEGTRMFMETPLELLQELYVCPEQLKGFPAATKEKLKKISYETISKEQFRRISDTDSPQGILGIVKINSYNIEDIVQKAALDPEEAIYMLLEDIQDPGNLGTIIRTCEAAGVKAVIMSKETVDIYNPKVVRATMGGIYRMPFLYVEDMVETVTYLKNQGIKIYGGSLKGKNPKEIEISKKRGFLIGNEGNGLSGRLEDSADILLRIPMKGRTESLNASIAAALFAYMGKI